MANLPNDIYLPETQNTGSTTAILMMTADKTEDLEFFYPYYRFIEAGYKVDVATPSGGEFKGKQGLGLKQSKKMSEIDPSAYALLYIPGGKAPAQLKEDQAAVELVKKFASLKRPIAAICHGPQLLAKADVIKGCKISAWPEIEDEIKTAGATYVSQECLTDGQFTTARWPADLPAHMKQVLKLFASASGSSTKLHVAA